jgi:hypothetical protein
MPGTLTGTLSQEATPFIQLLVAVLMVSDNINVLHNEVVHSAQHIDLDVEFLTFSNQVFFIFQLGSTKETTTDLTTHAGNHGLTPQHQRHPFPMVLDGGPSSHRWC